MATPDPAAAAPGTDAVAPARRFAARVPAKLLVLSAAGVVGLAGVAAAAAAFWPAAEAAPGPSVYRPKKAKRPKAAASVPATRPHAAAATPASGAEPDVAPPAVDAAHVAPPAIDAVHAATAEPSAAVAASAPASAASAAGPESTMDRLQRRLTETLGTSGSLELGVGEMKLTSRRSADAASAPRRSATAAPTPGAGGHREATHWSYDGSGGPDAWGRLQPGYADECPAGPAGGRPHGQGIELGRLTRAGRGHYGASLRTGDTRWHG